MSKAFPQTFSREQIETLIPHRKPILLLDEVTDWSADEYIEASHFFSIDNPHFNGHFPGNPLLPGVLIVEAMAQSAAVLISLTKGLTSQNALYLFTGIEDVRFKAQLTPGNTLTMRIEKNREKMNIFQFSGTAFVNNERACTASFSAKLVLK